MQYNFLLKVNLIYQKLIEKRNQTQYCVIRLYNFKQLVDYMIELTDIKISLIYLSKHLFV